MLLPVLVLGLLLWASSGCKQHSDCQGDGNNKECIVRNLFLRSFRAEGQCCQALLC